MKFRLLWLPLVLAACSPSPAPPAASSSPAPAAEARGTPATETSALAQYRWRLSDATDSAGKRIDALFTRADKPLSLDFTANRLNVINSCNSISGSFRVEDGQMEIGQMAHTLMACPDPALASLDDAIGQRLQGKLKMSLQTDGPSPRLQLIAANGDTLTFTGEPTAETRFGGPGEIIFLEVSAQTVPCNHPLIPDKQCLSVRERHYDEHGLETGTPGEWRPLNQPIEGYTHEPGIRNVLRIKRFAIKNPPADAPNAAYVLDMVVESEKVAQ